MKMALASEGDVMHTRRLKRSIAALLLVLAVSGCGGDSARDSLEKARNHLSSKNVQAAIVELKSALQKEPNFGEARHLLGLTLIQAGSFMEAEVELRKSLASGYSEALVVPELARAMVLRGQSSKVIEEFGKTEFTEPGSQASLHATLADAYFTIGKLESAKTALAASLAADSKYIPALVLSARFAAIGKETDSALGTIGRILAIDPRSSSAWKLKGDIFQHVMGKPIDALTAYHKAIEIEPTLLQAHFDALTLLLRLGRLDEAAKQLAGIKGFAGQNPRTRLFEAQLAYQQKNFVAAGEITQQLLRQAPDSIPLLQLMGAVELQTGSLSQAEAHLTRASLANPGFSLARRLLLVTYLRSGQAAKALSTLESAIGKGDLDPSLYSLAGEIYLQNGDARRAEAYFAKALKLTPGDADKRIALGLSRLAGGHAAEGLDELKGVAASDARVNADMALISTYMRRNELDKALAAIGKLEAKQPDRPVAAELRGHVQLLQGDKVAARASFLRALAIDANYFSAAGKLAMLEIAEGKPNDAKRVLTSFLEKNPKNELALLAIADLSANQGGTVPEILELFNKAIEFSPTSPAPRYHLVNFLLARNDSRKALTIAQSASLVMPDSPEIMDALGRAQRASGDINQAIAAFNKAIALQPNLPTTHIRLAEAYAANKNTAAAEKSLRRALEIAPDAIQAQRALAVLLLGQKKMAEALAIAKKIQVQRPRDSVGLVIEGDVRAWQQDWSGALVAYRSAQKISATSEVASKVHVALLNTGKAAEAESLATAWIKTHPTDAQFLSEIGEAAIKHKDFMMAERSLAQLLRLQPENPLALNNMAWVMHRLKKDEAFGHAEKANALLPNQPAFMDTLAIILSGQGKHSKAIEIQLKAVALQPSNPSFQLNLAKIFVAAGDKARAKSQLEAIIYSGEKQPAYQDAVALLKTIS